MDWDAGSGKMSSSPFSSPSKMPSAVVCIEAFGISKPRFMSVSVGPMTTAWTLTPWPANSALSDCVMFERGRLRNGVAGNDRQGRERRHGHVVDDGPFGAFQQWQEGACDIERSEEVDSQLLLEGLGIAQIVVESDAGIVDEDVEGVD